MPFLRTAILAVMLGCFLLKIAGAAEFEYPELVVTPRASQRLEIESQKEDQRSAWSHLPIQVSAASTLVAGFIQLANKSGLKGDSSGLSAVTAMGVGGAWLVGTFLMSQNYRPYQTALKEIEPMPKGTQREQLTRERLAEEAIERAASNGSRLAIFSAITNGAAGIYLISKANSGDFNFVADAVVIGLSLAPVLFPYHWQEVASEQRDYKKRIYGPVAQITAFPMDGGRKWVPGMAFSLQF